MWRSAATTTDSATSTKRKSTRTFFILVSLRSRHVLRVGEGLVDGVGRFSRRIRHGSVVPPGLPPVTDDKKGEGALEEDQDEETENDGPGDEDRGCVSPLFHFRS